MNTLSSIPESPVHFLSALVVIALDFVWSFLEGAVSLSIVGLLFVPFLSICIAGITFASVTLIQFYIAKDTVGQALAKGVALGILAGVPYMIMGTVVGIPLLTWSGLNQLKSSNSSTDS